MQGWTRLCAVMSTALLLTLGVIPAQALSLADLTASDAAGGVRAALERGAAAAVDQLGASNGFMGNPQVRIPLPEGLRQAESGLRMLGMGRQADRLVESMNRAAEGAVAEARPLLLDAVRKMTVSDAKQILTGGETSVTQFFREKTQARLTEQFLPLVRQTTGQLGLAQQYNQFAGAAAQFGAVRAEDANVENYVTRKAIDGLYQIIGEQEKAIRQDPIGTGSKLLGRVFGTIK